jgi:hypothetical protein
MGATSIGVRSLKSFKNCEALSKKKQLPLQWFCDARPRSIDVIDSVLWRHAPPKGQRGLAFSVGSSSQMDKSRKVAVLFYQLLGSGRRRASISRVSKATIHSGTCASRGVPVRDPGVVLGILGILYPGCGILQSFSDHTAFWHCGRARRLCRTAAKAAGRSIVRKLRSIAK